MQVVVTGASGHLGVNLVRELLARGDSVRVLVHRSSASLASLGVEQVSGSVMDPACLEAAFAGAARVYHLAAVISVDGDPDGRVRQVNVEGTANVARACRSVGVGRLVHVSSFASFARQPLDGVLDETRAQVTDSHADESLYARSKAGGERAVRKEIEQGLDAVIVNPTAITGNVDPEPSRMGAMLLDLAAGKMPALLEGGFDVVDVRDVVAGTIAAGERGQTGANYILGGFWISMVELAAIASSVTGVPAPKMVTPMWVARLTVPLARLGAKLTRKPAAISHEALDVLVKRSVSWNRAERELDFRPRPLTECIHDAYRWFAEQGKLAPAVRERVLGRSGAE